MRISDWSSDVCSSDLVPGKGNLILTGQLGDVMKESASAARSVVRARADRLGIELDFLQTLDVHVPVPEGATPKDGPNAGIAIANSMVSPLSTAPVRDAEAWRGESNHGGQGRAKGRVNNKR